MSPARKASNALLRTWCAGIRGDVLSVGSGTDADGNGATYRGYFTQASSYTTSEPVETPLCDRVLDVRVMPDVPDEAFDAVFCSGVLEHVDEPWAAVAECYRILKPGGVFLVGVPFQQPLHRVPFDYWRFTEFGVRHLLKAFRVDELKPIGDPKFPTTYWTKAVKA